MRVALASVVVTLSSLVLADTPFAYDVPKPGAWALAVHVEGTSAGGTMHFADRVTIQGHSGSTVLATAPDAVEKGSALAPLLTKQHRLDADHVLLLGWSSAGAGMQTYHALTVDARSGKVMREIVWTGDRGAAGHGVAIAGARVGFPVSTSADAAVHAGRVTYDAPALARVARSAAPADAVIYAEPFAPVSPSVPRVWFDALP